MQKQNRSPVHSAAAMLGGCLILLTIFLAVRTGIDRCSRLLWEDGTCYSADQLLEEAQEKLRETKVFRSTWIWSLESQEEGDNRRTICRQKVLYRRNGRTEIRTGTVLAEHNGRQYEESFVIRTEAEESEERLTERVQIHGSAAVELRTVTERGFLTEMLQGLQIRDLRAGIPVGTMKTAGEQIQEASLVLTGSLEPEYFMRLLEAADGLELYPAWPMRESGYRREVPLELELDRRTHEMRVLRLALDGIGLEIRLLNEQENNTCM